MFLKYRFWVWIPCLLAAVGQPTAQADNFDSVRYDSRTDELVATLFYRGTNPHHTFTLQWGECKGPGASAGKVSQITAEVLDKQWNDAARHDYMQTVRFSLAGLRCRPAELTLWAPPRFYYTLLIPAADQPARDASRSSAP